MLSNKELETLIKMENLVGKFEKQIFGNDLSKVIKVEWYDGTITEITSDDFQDFLSIIAKQLLLKKEKSQKQNEFNKAHKEYHRITNNISTARKSGNEQKLAFWQSKLQEYKLGKGGV